MRLTPLLAAAVAFASVAYGRIMAIWTYEALITQSDLVVIAVPVESRDTDERVDLPGIRELTPENKEVGMPAIGIETQFEVSVVIKGLKRMKGFTLHHYRLATPQIVSFDGPALVAFGGGQRRAFLMFLVREKDGRYAPTSGQTDPGMYSIHPLVGPVAEDPGQPARSDNGG